MELVLKVFIKRNFFFDRYINLLKFDKVNYKKYLKDIMNDFILEDVCKEVNLDCLLMVKDMVVGEEIFFICFCDEGEYIGIYKDVLLWVVMEVIMFVLIYFLFFEWFVDGGIMIYNNFILFVIMEVVYYGFEKKYDFFKFCVFSFGIGIIIEFIELKGIKNLDGLDVLFWLDVVMWEFS